MKISDFGKSGPRLVTSGLVCASAADGPAAIQPDTASATKIRRNIPGISILLIDSVCRFSLSWPAAVSRDLYRNDLYRHKSRWQSRGTLHPRDNGVFTNFGKSWRPPALRSQYRNNACVVRQDRTNWSNRHVDTAFGLSRDYPSSAKTQSARAHSRRRGLAGRRPDIGNPRGPQSE